MKLSASDLVGSLENKRRMCCIHILLSSRNSEFRIILNCLTKTAPDCF